MVFSQKSHQIKFEEMTMRFFRVLATAMHRHKRVGCIQMQVELDDTNYSQWKGFAANAKTVLREYSLSKGCDYDVRYFAVKQVKKKKLVFHAYWFIDGDVLEKNPLDIPHDIQITADMAGLFTNIDHFFEHYAITCTAFPSFTFPMAEVDENLVLLLNQVGQLIRCSCIRRKGKWDYPSHTTHLFTFDISQHLFKFISSSSNFILSARSCDSLKKKEDKKWFPSSVTTPKATPLQKETWLSPEESEEKEIIDTTPNTTGQLAPLQSSAFPLLGMVRYMLDALTQLESALHPKNAPRQKVLNVGDEFYFGLFLSVRSLEKQTAILDFNEVIYQLSHVKTLAELTHFFKVDDIYLRPVQGVITALNEKSITVQTKRKCVELTNDLYDIKRPVFHDYFNREIYKWEKEENGEIIYCYELDYVIHLLLTHQDKGDFFIPSLVESIVRLCDKEIKIKAKIKDKFRWLQIAYQKSNL